MGASTRDAVDWKVVAHVVGKKYYVVCSDLLGEV